MPRSPSSPTGSSFFIFIVYSDEKLHMGHRIINVLLLLICMTTSAAFAQKKDSTANKILENKLAKEILEAVTRKQPLEQNQRNRRSEDAFIPYQGKIIRRIYIRRIGFNKSIYDTTRNIKNTVTKIANGLHTDTRTSVIKDNLFFRENRPLNPYKLADNERYLRDLDFILDSRIRVMPVRGVEDSVDIEVVTRDVFSLGGRARVSGIDKFSVGIYDANLAGLGQRVEGEFLFERDRNPVIGKQFLYTKSSLGGSLVNVSAGYTELDNALSSGEENEYAFFVRLSRPLVSPYSRLAGELEISRNWSVNVFQNPDSLFAAYRYTAHDVWVGYNMGIKNTVNDRSRHFAAVRYYRQDFISRPIQENERARLLYNDNQFVLGQLTFYNQNFYKTSYVYGFGRTEDIPYGQTINLTAGWTHDIAFHRFYTGASAIKRIVRPSGRFYDIEAGAGAFFRDDQAEDGTLYIRGVFYSKLYDVNKVKVRHRFSGGYARAFNNKVRELLTLNREVPGFSADSLYGHQRFSLSTETTVFTPLQLLGFRFAPFLSLEGAHIRVKEEPTTFHNEFFWGSTGGIRIRNENLIFGTIEFRAFYYPKVVPGVDQLSFKVTTNVRIKYSGTFVTPPDFVRYN